MAAAIRLENPIEFPTNLLYIHTFHETPKVLLEVNPHCVERLVLALLQHLPVEFSILPGYHCVPAQSVGSDLQANEVFTIGVDRIFGKPGTPHKAARANLNPHMSTHRESATLPLRVQSAMAGDGILEGSSGVMPSNMLEVRLIGRDGRLSPADHEQPPDKTSIDPPLVKASGDALGGPRVRRSGHRQSVVRSDGKTGQRNEIRHPNASRQIRYLPLHGGQHRPSEDRHDQARTANLGVATEAAHSQSVDRRKHEGHATRDGDQGNNSDRIPDQRDEQAAADRNQR